MQSCVLNAFGPTAVVQQAKEIVDKRIRRVRKSGGRTAGASVLIVLGHYY